MKNFVKFVSLLIVLIANTLFASETSIYTPLCRAVRYNDVTEVKAWVKEHGIDAINHQNKRGETVVHWIARNGNAEMLDVLINAGADIHAKNSLGSTPLLEATKKNNVQAAKTLIKHGADVNVQDTYGDTPLHLAVGHEDLQLALLLRKNGAVENHNGMGETPYDIALNAGDSRAVRLLGLDFHYSLEAFENRIRRTRDELDCNNGNDNQDYVFPFDQLIDDNLLGEDALDTPPHTQPYQLGIFTTQGLVSSIYFNFNHVE